MLNITSNAHVLGDRLSNIIARQIPFATSRALTNTAHMIREGEQTEMRRVFDRPTPFVLNAFQVIPARKDKLVAEVRFKDAPAYMRRHFLEPQVFGGGRGVKAFERLLQAAHLTDSDGQPIGNFVAAIPSRMAQKDKNGNWSPGERNRVLSALQAQRDTLTNTTAASRRRNPRRAEYFIRPRAGGGATVFRKTGDSIDPVLLLTPKAPQYTRRLDFYGVANRIFAGVYEAEFQAALRQALATAK